MRVIRCDRCGKDIQIAGEKSVGFVSILWRDLKNDDLTGTNPYDHWDVCPECMEEIQAVIEKRAEAPAKAEKKKGKIIDKGKIDALWDAGWTEGMIAEEMHLPEKKIRELLKEMGLVDGGLR